MSEAEVSGYAEMVELHDSRTVIHLSNYSHGCVGWDEWAAGRDRTIITLNTPFIDTLEGVIGTDKIAVDAIEEVTTLQHVYKSVGYGINEDDHTIDTIQYVIRAGGILDLFITASFQKYSSDGKPTDEREYYPMRVLYKGAYTLWPMIDQEY